MAALSDQRFPVSGSLVDLTQVHPSELDRPLEAEATEWREQLNWDFAASANLIKRFVHMRALTGVAWRAPDHATHAPFDGYAYYVADEGKGLIGGLYVTPEQRTPEVEDLLLSTVLESMWRTSGVRRIEAQLMMLTSPFDRQLPYPAHVKVHPRKFLQVPLTDIVGLPSRSVAVGIAPWSENRQGDAARLIAASYVNHIDSRINDQYRSPAGARRFLGNIVQYPGCGSFFAPASLVAFSRDPSRLFRRASESRPLGYDHGPLELSGVCLASLIASGVGHITQVCVAPAERGTGLGYELMRRSMVALAQHGCHTVTLTVTSDNVSALAVYERMGFRCHRDFAAYVWDKR